ncbi:MAG: prepilin peptidase [Nanoarchaeota archaeon]
MFHIIFLVALALVWMIFAVVQDLKKREIANWVNFSLIIFAIGFRFFYSLFNGTEDGTGFNFFYQGLIGLGIFFILGNLLYYCRMFAGGDAKLLFALGAILPFSENFFVNLKVFALFFVLFLFSGAVYGLFVSGALIFSHFKGFKKEFLKQFKQNKNLFILSLFLALFFIILGFSDSFMIYFGILIFILPYFYLSAKSIDEVCMIKKISPKNLTEGDWLYKDVMVGNRVIKKSWNGLTKKEIKLLRKNKYVLVRQGIPFSPAFLISFLILIYLWFFRSGILIYFWG